MDITVLSAIIGASIAGVCGVTSGLLGVIIGGAITYFVQSRLQEKERKWEEKKAYKAIRREDLLKLSETLRSIGNPFMNLASEVWKGKSPYASVRDNIQKIAGNILFQSDLLVNDKILYRYSLEVHSLLMEGVTLLDKEPASDDVIHFVFDKITDAFKIYYKMQLYVNRLLDETYK